MSSRALDTRFMWAKPKLGFEWYRTNKSDWRLRWKSERKGGYIDWYHPPTNLFREFASSHVTPAKASQMEAFLRFANDYGDILALPNSARYERDGNNRRIARPFALLSLCRFQAEQMQWAVGLWDRCNGASTQKERLQARKDLQIEIEAALKDTKTPSCARVCLNQKMDLFVYPVNLLAFMWLTFARLASGEIAERRCIGCGSYIYTGVGPGLKKTGTTTCSATCRKRKERL